MRGRFTRLTTDSSEPQGQDDDEFRQSLTTTTAQHAVHQPAACDFFRYRLLYGTNMGSLFVLEKWLTPSMFPEGADTSELAAVSASIDQYGHSETRKKWEKHWATFLQEDDIAWLAQKAKCNTVRLPIGYFTLGPSFCVSTPFADAGHVYTNAWAAVKHVVARLRAHGIATLIDLHALPGGANSDDHSGTNSGRAELWDDRQNLDLATRCAVFLAHELRGLDGIAGLQVCNEAEQDAPGMYEWYEHVLTEISKVDRTLPIYMSDGWDLAKAVRWAQTANALNTQNPPVVIDTHKYWAFSEIDRKKSPQQIIAEAEASLPELHSQKQSMVGCSPAEVIVGEYSCALDQASWNKAGRVNHAELLRDFGQAQCRRWQDNASGSFFWTTLMEGANGDDWCFRRLTEAGAIAAPRHLTIEPENMHVAIAQAQRQRDGSREAAVAGHVSYWAHIAPEKPFEHWRFEHGWDVGYSDASHFFAARSSGLVGPSCDVGGDKIGLLDLWVRKRLLDREDHAESDFAWEFETGLRQGVYAFYEAAGI